MGALVAAWYPGMEGGRAVADILFGHEIPGGRLPCSWPASTTQLPPFKRFTRKIAYGPLHGYRMHEAEGTRPAYPFGYGLGYTKVEWEGPEVVGAEAGRVQGEGAAAQSWVAPGGHRGAGVRGRAPRLRPAAASHPAGVQEGADRGWRVGRGDPRPPAPAGGHRGRGRPVVGPDHLRPVPVTAA